MEFWNLLNKYITGNIAKKELYKQIKGKFNDLLEQERFYELEYLKVYPFMSELQDEDLYEKDVLNVKIGHILDIYSGQATFSYDMWMKLGWRDVKELKHIWISFLKEGKIAFEEYEYLQNEQQRLSSRIETVEDICKKKLLMLLLGLPTTDENFYTYNLLYCEAVRKTIIQEEVEKLICILEGTRPVHLQIEYINGAAQIFIL